MHVLVAVVEIKFSARQRIGHHQIFITVLAIGCFTRVPGLPIDHCACAAVESARATTTPMKNSLGNPVHVTPSLVKQNEIYRFYEA